MMPELFKDWKITTLTFEIDTEPYAMQRDDAIEKLAKSCNVNVIKRVSHTLYDTEKTISKNGGSPPLTYQRLQTVLKEMGAPPKPSNTLTSSHLSDCTTPWKEEFDEKYGVPTLAELGKNEEDCGPLLFPGGEMEALSRMERYLKKTNWICKFEKPQTEPNSLEPSTTVLSPYIKFGCLSVRTFYYRLLDIYNLNKVYTKPPVSLHGQLLWREFFYTAGVGTANFNRMEGNPVCTQVPWDSNPEYLAAWSEARTGYPFIDAIMTQLRTEGWIHHLARHAVACFLTRGDLWLSWEEGQKVFEELLLDADWYLNAGNWLWLSASAFFHQYFRVYSPVAFGKKTDKNGDYIKLLAYFSELHFPYISARQLHSLSDDHTLSPEQRMVTEILVSMLQDSAALFPFRIRHLPTIEYFKHALNITPCTSQHKATPFSNPFFHFFHLLRSCQ
ncbi:cryptochrome-1-like isoform X3 [Pomacea canaliculata]|uniref:cryptochrome-1-like isoform X3 n=1 Tax=Pomacea canaliculata TaxID=400727 RepID=UPI000D72EEDA|nr:cryptochrome-1-like isoform X3 [Pomacea canaliculata]